MPITKVIKLGKKQKDYSDKKISKMLLSKKKKKGKRLGLRKIFKELCEQYFSNLQS